MKLEYSDVDCIRVWFKLHYYDNADLYIDIPVDAVGTDVERDIYSIFYRHTYLPSKHIYLIEVPHGSSFFDLTNFSG